MYALIIALPLNVGTLKGEREYRFVESITHLMDCLEKIIDG
jgi:hypothetical protein